MRVNWRTQWMGLAVVTALLLVGLAPVASWAAMPTAIPGTLTGANTPVPEVAAWTPAQLKPIHKIYESAASAVKAAPGQNADSKLPLPEAAAQLQQQIKAAGINLHSLPKGRFQAPAYRMFVNSLVKAGVPVSEAVQANPESLCTINSGAWIGPTTASNTNGTAIVYGGGLNFYFASASDPTHPTVMPMGDMMMRVYFHGNTALVLGAFYSYEFDVTNPTHPALINYDWGMYGRVVSLGMTGDGQYIVAAEWDGDNIDVFDSGFNYIGTFDIENLYEAKVNPAGFPYYPEFTDMTIDGSVVILPDYDNMYIHFVDLSSLSCSSDPTYLGYIDDSLYGSRTCGQILYQAPYLYTTDTPWWKYQPIFSPICAHNGYSIDIFSVPATTNPANFISVKTIDITNYGNDIIAIRPGGGSNVALGLYDGQVAVWDAQFNNLLSFGTFGKFGPASQGYGWCGSEPNWEYFTLDMGYDPTAGGVTANWGGGAYFFNGSLAAAGSYKTGDWAYNPIAVGNTIYAPSYVAGLAIINNADPTAPTTLGWLDTMPSLPFIGKVAVDGTTAYVAADYNTSFTKVFAADVTNPASPAYISTPSTAFDITASPGYGTQVESLAANGGICWIGTDTHIVGVDFLTNPSAPTVVASFTLTGTGAFKMATFTMPAFPLSTFLAAAEGMAIQIIDITSPAQYTGCQTPYFVTYSTPTGNYMTDIFVLNGYSFTNSLNQNGIWSFQFAANINDACQYGEVIWTGNQQFLSTALPVANTAPYLLSYAGTVGGHVVAAAAVDPLTAGKITAMTTFDITNPLGMTFLNNPPQIVGGAYFGTGITGMVFSNSALYNAGGWIGLYDYLLEPGFKAPTVNSVTVSPSFTGYLTGPVTLTANVTAADSAVTEVVFTFDNNKIATVPTNIAAGATADVTYTWNTSAWGGSCGAYDVYATAYDAGCNESAALGSGSTYNINLAPTVSFSNWTPPIPTGTSCTAAGAWIVCGTMTFTATGVDGSCNQPPQGISQMALYLDGSKTPLTYINNPLNGVWKITLDTTTLSDGPHTVTVTATDNQGLTGSATSATFTVHNVGPATYVVEPVSGDVVSGQAVPLSANVVLGPSSPGIANVKFYLDSTNTTTVANVIATGTLIGTATTQDATGNWVASPAWDSRSTPYGNHIIVAVASELSSATCAAQSMSPLVSFRLIAYTPPSITATATPTSGNIPLAVAFAANVTNGQAPFTYAWTFGDGNTGSNQATTHTYTTAGTFNWSVTVTDAQNNTATASGAVTAINPVVPPTVSSIHKATNPFRLIVLGSNFHSAVTASIGGTPWTNVVVKSGSKVVIKGGKSLKALLPKATPVAITITNTDDGGTSAVYTFTR